MALPSLDSPRAKLDQAAKHIHALFEALQEYVNPQRLALETRHDVDTMTGDDVWRLVVREAPPISLSVIAGDVAHNLRSCLDHLVWQLALTQTQTPFRLAQFPICSIPDNFNDIGKRQIQDLHPDAQALIESVQPYHGSDTGSHLAVLQDISNTDKHRITIGVLPRPTGMHYPFWCAEYVDPAFINSGFRQHNDIVLRIRQGPDRLAIEPYLDRIRFAFDLGLDTPKAHNHTSGIIATFNSIHMAINEQLLLKCRHFFP